MYRNLISMISYFILCLPVCIHSEDDFLSKYNKARINCLIQTGIPVNVTKVVTLLYNLPKAKCVDKCAQEKLYLREPSSTRNIKNKTTKYETKKFEKAFNNCFDINSFEKVCPHAKLLYQCLLQTAISTTHKVLEECASKLKIAIKESWMNIMLVKHLFMKLLDDDNNACLVRCIAIKIKLANENSDILFSGHLAIPGRQNLIIDNISQMCHNTNNQADECLRVSRRLECFYNNLIDNIA